MAEAAEQVRPGRRRAGRHEGRVVAVTGAARGVGRLLAQRLLAEPSVREVVGLDDHRGDLDGVRWRVVDVADPAVAARLTGCGTVVHTDVDMDPDAPPQARRARSVRAVQAVLTAAAAAGVRRAVVLSSAMVYGALPDNPVPLDEDAPLLAIPNSSVVGDLLAVEEVCQRARTTHPGLSVTVVRPAAVVGPGVDTVLTRHFESPRLLVLKGTSPRWQFCHIDDLAAALAVAVVRDLDGPVTVGCDGWLTQDEVESVTGLARLELPAAVALGAAERLHRLGVIRAPASDLAYVSYPWVVPSTRLRTAGWRPVHDNVSALQALLGEVAGRHAVGARRVGRRESATLGAAGATMAALGAAAAVRRARRARRRRRR